MSEPTQPCDVQLLTPQEVARQLVVEPSTLAYWRSTGSVALPFVKIGGQVRYRRPDVQRFIEANVKAAA